MSSGECTNSGNHLWLNVAFAISGLVMVQFWVFVENTVSAEDLTENVITATSELFGVTAGMTMLYQGLGNADFNMAMRVGLVSIGSLITGASLFAGFSSLLN
jgi:hypothetical protein